MTYKTTVLALLEQWPQLYDQLRASRTLLSTMERLATGLKDSHDHWKNHLRQSMPGSSESEISSAALELALKELEAVLSSVSPKEEDDPQTSDQRTTEE